MCVHESGYINDMLIDGVGIGKIEEGKTIVSRRERDDHELTEGVNRPV